MLRVRMVKTVAFLAMVTGALLAPAAVAQADTGTGTATGVAAAAPVQQGAPDVTAASDVTAVVADMGWQ
ncbi:hypothetical protein ACIPPS_21525 [Streptomyces sp. NPDC090127]|uniref:hypothetical protein n=1 Tax=Streptomyces sp. NPDC090127 TaxID=3365953 RepID=UPI0037F406ED